MREHVAEIIIGALVLTLAGFFLVYSIGAGERNVSGGYPLIAEFSSVSGLAVGSDVRMSGVKVGSVSDIELNPNTYQAEVELRVNNDVPVPTDSFVALKGDGLLGGVHLSIEPGAEADMLEAGDRFEFPGQGAIDVLRLMSDFIQNSADNE